ncbi:MAG: YcaO-like family protein [Gammaproteobacteria bacterium]
MSAAPIDPDTDFKRYRQGTHRTRHPADTLARARTLMRECGITRIANVTGLDRIGIPVVMVTRPNARSLAVSQGKGIDLDSAKASGLMEAIEGWHAEHIVSHDLRLASFDELREQASIVDVTQLVCSAGRRFDAGAPMLWIEGRKLAGAFAEAEPCWLPLETVSTDYTEPAAPGSGAFAATSNGLASGNTYDEALCHALCEVIERDALTLWHLGSRRNLGVTGLDPETVDDPACRQLMACFDRAGVQLKIWETTSDIGVAAFECLAAGRDDDWADPEYGAGCHPSRAVALARAITEAAQARVSFIAGSRDDFGSHLYTGNMRKRRRRHCFAQMAAHRPTRRFTDAPDCAADTVREDVETVLQRLETAGIAAPIVVDLTRHPDVAHIVRVVVPGLEGAYDHEQGDFTPGQRARAVSPAFKAKNVLSGRGAHLS